MLLMQQSNKLCVSTKEVTNRPEFAIPSLVLKKGYALRKCISIEREQALRAGDLKSDKSFLSLLVDLC